MKALGWWLIAVGTLRLASVWFGFFDIWALRLAVFSNTTKGNVVVPPFAFHKLSECFQNRLYIGCIFISGIPFFHVTEVHGRTFGTWTLLTCTLCYICAFNLENKPLYLATFLSFIYALGHFLTEYLIYRTMEIKNLTTVGIFAGTSIVWMLLQWNSHSKVHLKHS